MANYTVNKDYTTGERCGASGTFQVISLEDEIGNDCVESLDFDQGIHFHNNEDLKHYIAELRRKKGLPDEPINLDEV